MKEDTLIAPKERGGLNLSEFETKAKALQTAWVQRMKKEIFAAFFFICSNVFFLFAATVFICIGCSA